MDNMKEFQVAMRGPHERVSEVHEDLMKEFQESMRGPHERVSGVHERTS